MAWDRLAAVLTLGWLGLGLGGCRVDDSGYTFPTASGGTSAAGSAGSDSSSGGSSGSGGSGGTSEPDGGSGGVVPSCPKGQHMCVVGCVPDDDIGTCGTSCAPCEPPIDGLATCDGTRCGGDCRPGQKLCRGVCIAEADACEGGCPDGTHACGDSCLLDTSVNGCGTECDPCPTPANATQATCDGSTCDFTCLTGFHECGDSCVADADAASCGPECMKCDAPKSGKALCIDGVCAEQCDAGFHACNDECVSDTSPLSCGKSCEPCAVPTGGDASCKAGKCGSSCPSGQKVCFGKCIANGAACEGTCETGTHPCNDLCVSDVSTNSCGKSCTACPLPNGASEASCSGGSCGFKCGSGFHACGSRCAANDDATACGATCRDCPDDPNGNANCQNDTCGTQCKSGYHLCGGQCVSNKDVASCGATSCSACTKPSGGSVGCDGLACQPTCPSGKKLCNGACVANDAACNGTCAQANTHICNGTCVANNSVDHCGSSCSACAKPQNGSSTCNGTSCGISCTNGFHQCGNACSANSSVNSCGSSCSACPAAPANATATCNGTSCGFTCKSGFTGNNCEFPRVQTVPLPGGYASGFINAMSTDGSVVAGTLYPVINPQQARAFRWAISSSSVTVIQPAGEDGYAVGSAISGDGTRVFGYGPNTTFQWTSASKTVQLNRATAGTVLYGADLTGAIAAGIIQFSQATIYDANASFGSFLLPTAPDYTSTGFTEVTDKGDLSVGFAYNNGTQYPVRWTNTGYVQLADAEGTAQSVSADGRFIVGRLGGGAVRWSGSSFQTVQNLPAPSGGDFECNAMAVSTDGSTIVGWASPVAGGLGTAVVWVNGSAKRLIDLASAAGFNTSGWAMNSANQVSANGKIVAASGSKDGEDTSFIVRLP